MSNYFETIEQTFSKIRGQHSRLNPIDWQLAGEWEEKIPLHIVLTSMDEVSKKFSETRRPDKINSLSYFKQSVEKNFAEYAAAQVGKNTEENDMEKAISREDQSIQTLKHLISSYSDRNDLPQSAAISVRAVAADLRELLEITRKVDYSITDIEYHLSEIAFSLMPALVVCLSDDERNALIAEIERENKHRTLDDDSRAKIANKKLYQKYNLPELTLFEI